MNGTHRPDGIFVAIGDDPEGVASEAATRSRLGLADVAPTLLRIMDVRGEGDASATLPERLDYTDEEDAMVAERLRALGYLE